MQLNNLKLKFKNMEIVISQLHHHLLFRETVAISSNLHGHRLSRRRSQARCVFSVGFAAGGTEATPEEIDGRSQIGVRWAGVRAPRDGRRSY